MTDEELMLAVCNGDQSAYQAIVKKHLKPISHYAFRMLGSTKDTEDITQETFLRLWLNAAKWEPRKSNLSTWLHRIAHNLCIDYLRKHSRLQQAGQCGTEQDWLEKVATSHTDQQPGENTADLDAAAEAKLVHLALQDLPESQRSALMLCHYQGFSNKEAADIMNISVKALESAMARAKRSLRLKLQHLHPAILPGAQGNDSR